MFERKIDWNSGCFDEIDLVYDKAEADATIAGILAELEAGALAEARAYSHNIRIDGRPVTPEQFDTLPDHMKEHVMYSLSGMGLAAFSAPLTEPKIIVRLTPHIQLVRCCTAFSILNRLEKLDGAYNVRFPKATLEIQAPLGGKKGLVQIEMLICLLYPWLSVSEISTNEVAVVPAPEPPKPATQPAPAPVPPKPEEEQNSRPGFWARLFGKKK